MMPSEAPVVAPKSSHINDLPTPTGVIGVPLKRVFDPAVYIRRTAYGSFV
jgi:hypothetical protein